MGTARETVAFLGLGGMGRAMAGNALRAGLPTVVWNRTPRAAEALGGLGARVAGSAAEAAAQAAIVVTMVSDVDAVQAVAVDQGMLAALPPGAIWAQMSTIGIAGTERFAALVDRERPDVVFLDAPVAGSRGPAEAGQLAVYASGPTSARERVTPLFDAVGQRTVWVGPVGQGSRLKLVNNMLLAFLAEGVAESVALAQTVGIATETVLTALTGSPILPPWAEAKLRRMARDDYSPEFPLSLALKDVYLALDAVDPARFTVGGCLAAQWQRVLDRGFGGDDLTVVVRAMTPGAA
ncbi:3-hydroxyisobutyrate dehydrogenase [Micromonospora pisi]|uniref:3-hydroxyisobutyrate dehydrogenase n=1 Tax=Micromonospora pisi TaxID=589240 RepID=A0A495JFF1_9ACTN|nr:NAD(P)-dependent oxidoreductase [Micromonospora pisi]RKR87750.1 3-hydroxyisobutyrate dehydrogenase [Micromonospora pisi]